MKIVMIWIVIFMSIQLNAQKVLQQIESVTNQDKVKAHLEFLASDLLEGRNTGSQGLEIAASYIAAQFRSNGLEEVDGSYLQPVGFATFTPPDSSTLSVGDQSFDFKKDYIVINGRKESLTASTVDIGFGSSDEIENVDLRFKIAVSIAGDGKSQDPRDWIASSIQKRKKVKEAGGVALIEIYQSTAIPWRFLRRLGTQPQTGLDQEVDQNDLPNIWLGTTDDAVIQTLKGGDTPVILYMDAVERSKFTSANVVGMLTGTDESLSEEYMVYSAHYDHVGIGRPDERGDTIYNGARDNAVGVTAVLSLAEYFSKHPPKRSSIFVLFTAEEKGLLGSRYFTDNLPVPTEKIKYNFNIDNGGYNDTTIVSVIGLTRTEAEEDIQKACQLLNLTAIEDPAKEQGLFDRSDNVNFARLGIPAPTFSLGFRAFDSEIFKYYHRPGDEVASLNMNYIEKYVKAYLLSAHNIANRDSAPFWIEGDKYFESGVNLYKR